MSKPGIRPLEKTDIEIFDVLSQLTDIGCDKDYQKRLESFLENDKSSEIWVLDLEGKIVGTGKICIENKLIHNNGRLGHLEDLVVDKEHRRKGYGTTMIKHLLERAKEVGCYKVILQSSNDNMNYYRSFGFKEKDSTMMLYLQ